MTVNTVVILYVVMHHPDTSITLSKIVKYKGIMPFDYLQYCHLQQQKSSYNVTVYMFIMYFTVTVYKD